MSKNYFLGIDIGTFEAKGILCDAEGKIVASAARPHKMSVPQPGWAEHCAENDWWQGFVHIARGVLSESKVSAGEIAAVAVSAIGPCVVPVDKHDKPLTNAILYGVDTRAHREIDDLECEIGADRILAFNGNALTSQAIGPKLLWLRRNRPEAFAKADRFASSTPYLVRKLTGRWVMDHYTAANFTPLYNSHTRRWDDSLAPGIVEIERLPELMWSSEIAGAVTAKAASETGLAQGTPVTVGTIDAASEAVSVGVLEPGDLMVMYGSTMFFVTVAEEWSPNAKLWYAPWLFPDLHALLAGLATSGTLTHWFRDTLSRDLPPEDTFRLLAEEASGSPKGSKGLIVLPYFSGERTPIHDPHAKGCIFGLDLTHTRADLYRALLEGMAYGTRHVVETFHEAGAKLNRAYAVGGGTKNEIWLQSVSNICGLQQSIRSVTVGASFGDAFLAALAVGAVERSELENWNPSSRLIRSEGDRVYEKGYSAFRDLYEQTRGLMRQIKPG